MKRKRWIFVLAGAWCGAAFSLQISPDPTTGADDEADRTSLFDGTTLASRKANENADVWQPVPISTRAQQTAGYGGGEGFQMIWGIQYAPSNPDIVYMVVDTSQVWKSTDGGASWQRKQKGFYANGGASLGVHPTVPDIVFVAGGQMGGWKQLTPNRDGIYRTLDGGESWQLVKAGHHFSRYDTGELFQFPSKDVVYAGTFDAGILKSTDNGESWSTMVPFATTGMVHDIKLHPDDGAILFVSSANGYSKVEDKAGGVAVSPIGKGLASPQVSVISKDNPGIIHAINGDDDRIYRSTDGGQSFQPCIQQSYGQEDKETGDQPRGFQLYVRELWAEVIRKERGVLLYSRWRAHLQEFQCPI